jgi:hypothetical protein
MMIHIPYQIIIIVKVRSKRRQVSLVADARADLRQLLPPQDSHGTTSCFKVESDRRFAASW